MSVYRLVALRGDFDAKVGGESCESPAFRSRTIVQISRFDSIVSDNTVGIYLVSLIFGRPVCPDGEHKSSRN